MLGNKKIMGDNIQYYMDLKGIDRIDFAKAINVPYSSVTDWINGKSYPRIDKIQRMADFFGIEKADLVEARDTAKKSASCRIPVLGRVAAGIPIATTKKRPHHHDEVFFSDHVVSMTPFNALFYQCRWWDSNPIRPTISKCRI
jgi:repressor LexA